MAMAATSIGLWITLLTELGAALALLISPSAAVPAAAVSLDHIEHLRAVGNGALAVALLSGALLFIGWGGRRGSLLATLAYGVLAQFHGGAALLQVRHPIATGIAAWLTPTLHVALLAVFLRGFARGLAGSGGAGVGWLGMRTVTQRALEPQQQYLVENQYVLAGFRRDLSLRGCFASLFQLHNELFNAWSHIVGAAICVVLYKSVENGGSGAGAGFRVVVARQLVVNGILFVCSVSAHTFMAHSKWLSRRLYVVDRWAVAMNLFAHTSPQHAPHFYYALEGHPWALVAAKGLAYALLALAFWVGKRPVYTTAEKLRAVVCFGAPVACSFVAAAAELWSAGSAARVWPARWGLSLCAVFTIAGCVFHASKVPERLRPGTWDVFNSHGLMHCCAVLATVCNFHALQQLALH